MFVTCPNCKKEQPRETFCAYCGKKLTPLLKEQEAMNRFKNRGVKIALLSTIVLLFTFYYLNFSKLNALNHGKRSQNEPAKLYLSSAKIKSPNFPNSSKAETKKLNNSNPSGLREDLSLKSGAGSASGAKLNLDLNSGSKLDLAQQKAKASASSSSLKVTSLQLFQLLDCSEENLQDKEEFLSCSKKLLKDTRTERHFLTEQDSYNLQIEIVSKEKNIRLYFVSLKEEKEFSFSYQEPEKGKNFKVVRIQNYPELDHLKEDFNQRDPFIDLLFFPSSEDPPLAFMLEFSTQEL